MLRCPHELSKALSNYTNFTSKAFSPCCIEICILAQSLSVNYYLASILLFSCSHRISLTSTSLFNYKREVTAVVRVLDIIHEGIHSKTIVNLITMPNIWRHMPRKALVYCMQYNQSITEYFRAWLPYQTLIAYISEIICRLYALNSNCLHLSQK